MPIFHTWYDQKDTPVWADKILISDSQASNQTKFVEAEDLPISNAVQVSLDDKQDQIDAKVDFSDVIIRNDTTVYTPTGDYNPATKKYVDDSVLVVQSGIDAHEARTDNPHSVTKAQVGLWNVDNTSDADKPVSAATQTALDAKVDDSQISAFWLTLIDDANASDARTTLGLGTLATQSGTFSGIHSGASSGTNTGDQTATTVPNTPAGNIASTTVQGAIDELDTEKASLSGENTFSANQNFSEITWVSSEWVVGYWHWGNQINNTTVLDGSPNTKNNGTPTGYGFNNGTVSWWVSISNWYVRGNWTTGYVEVPNINGIQTIRLDIDFTTTTNHLFNIVGTSVYIWINAGVVTATGVTSPTIYVDWVTTSNITAGKRKIIITTTTAINWDNIELLRTANTNYWNAGINAYLWNNILTEAERTAEFNSDLPVKWDWLVLSMSGKHYLGTPSAPTSILDMKHIVRGYSSETSAFNFQWGQNLSTWLTLAKTTWITIFWVCYILNWQLFNTDAWIITNRNASWFNNRLYIYYNENLWQLFFLATNNTTNQLWININKNQYINYAMRVKNDWSSFDIFINWELVWNRIIWWTGYDFWIWKPFAIWSRWNNDNFLRWYNWSWITTRELSDEEILNFHNRTKPLFSDNNPAWYTGTFGAENLIVKEKAVQLTETQNNEAPWTLTTKSYVDKQRGSIALNNFILWTYKVIPYSDNCVALTTLAVTANRWYYIPFVVSQDRTITELWLSVSTAWGTKARVAIYDTLNNRPGSRLIQTWDFDTTTGYKSEVVNYTLLGWQVYWLFMVADWGTFRAVSVWGVYNYLGFLSTWTTACTHYLQTITAGWTDTPATAWTISTGTGNIPALFII